jgi:type VI secretion system secreted protein Hcp
VAAGVDLFLKIDGIQGEARDAKHKGEIDLESFSWGETSSSGVQGGGAGKVHIEDLHVVMKLNKASPLLFLACATGQHLKQAILTARKAGKAQLEFLVFKFTDLLVSSYHTSAGDDVEPTDQIAFNFGRIEMEYRPQKADGSLDTPVKAGWDVKSNKKV